MRFLNSERHFVLADEMLKEYYDKAFEDGYQKALLNKGPEGSYTYKQGYENGRRDQKIDDNKYDDDDIEFAIRAARIEGMNDAWKCARKAILEMSNEELRRIFGVDKWQDVFRKLSGAEAVYKYSNKK